ncbi:MULTISPECIES: DUF1822 family protein [unclassified Thermosynechococcus]|uniref:DUF1822 family protein n=1 Tax=unclassified Thermosynechococcus TaxID=2622553 RepID=UPI002872DBC0|nr:MULTISPECIES: DUF1822 family protein [unclassified Thermosynechococcus]WNC31380.1 DUF1822 family protein [Thermosynechococcus sp. PKX95]WNC33904.1 DUF1822 family protein [Thermosynechococcus sp. PKX91]WNC36428.1 DUF1822 family protein [Thermosynechococcus sp. WL11]WNC38949.1 DUF1822 family protein [Thermosynechococcus sp. WL17]WNC41471.1 DUF1822 family protein [Thermosynechococcus sp. WL15]
MTSLSLSFLTAIDAPPMAHTEHVHIDLADAGDRQWIEQITAAARAYRRGSVRINAMAYVAVRNWFAAMGISADPFLSTVELPIFWEFVNGTLLTTAIGQVLIVPDTSIELDECRIPQEWLHIAAWKPDYILGVQVFAEEAQVRLWGYAPSSSVNRSAIDALSRTYTLDREDMIEDVPLLAALPACHHIPVPSPAATAIPTATLQQIASGEMLLPRLVLPLEEWLHIIGQPRHRLDLFLACHPQRLSLWLYAKTKGVSNLLGQVWQDVQELLEEGAMLNPYLSWKLGWTSPEWALRSNDTLEAMQAQAQLRQALETEDCRQAVALLKDLIATTADEGLRWMAAEYLHAQDATAPEAGVWKTRTVDLGLALGGQSFGLVMAVLPRDTMSANILVRVTALKVGETLPPDLVLMITEANGNTFAQVTSRQQDQAVQYKFWGQIGETFGITLAYGDAKITETFVV